MAVEVLGIHFDVNFMNCWAVDLNWANSRERRRTVVNDREPNVVRRELHPSLPVLVRGFKH